MHYFYLTFDLAKIILTCLYVFGVFLIITLNIDKLNKLSESRTPLTILLVICVLEIINMYSQRFIPTDLTNFGPFLTLLLGPFLFRYVRTEIMSKFIRPNHFFLHLIPACLSLLLVTPNSYRLRLVITLFVCVHFGSYFLASARILFQQRNKHQQSRVELWHLLGVTFLVYLSMSIETIFFSDAFMPRYAILLLFIVISYLVARYILLKVLSVYYFHKYEKSDTQIVPSKKYRNSTLTSQSSSQLAQELTVLMQSEKLFLQEGLSLAALSKKLETSPKYLSQAINENLNCSFFDLTNNYRIEEAKQMLTSDEFSDHKIYEIMYAVGFNSRSSFINAFKKNTGLTPTEYKSQFKND